jgi:conjugal transfer pilus assembly protein TraV
MTKLMVNNIFFKSALIILTMALQGCAYLGIGQDDYSCPGGAEGVHCMSARQVYQATESTDYVKTKVEIDGDVKGKVPNSIGAGNDRSHVDQVAVPRIGQPVPIRTQARVMRIWMAAWEDEDADLHADGFLYTEIEERKWNLGGRFKSPGTNLSPLTASAPVPLSK